MDGKNTGYKYLLLAALLLPLAAMGFKLFALDYPLAGLVPTVSYRVALNMQVDGHGEDIKLATYLPMTTHRQQVTDQPGASVPFHLSLESARDNDRRAGAVDPHLADG